MTKDKVIVCPNKDKPGVPAKAESMYNPGSRSFARIAVLGPRSRRLTTRY
jgi:hypothetical protein